MCFIFSMAFLLKCPHFALVRPKQLLGQVVLLYPIIPFTNGCNTMQKYGHKAQIMCFIFSLSVRSQASSLRFANLARTASSVNLFKLKLTELTSCTTRLNRKFVIILFMKTA